MPPAMNTKIGFIGSTTPARLPHDSVKAFMPDENDFTYVQEAGEKAALYDARGKVDALIGHVRELVAEHGWHGVIISGALKEALNPGMWDRVSAELRIPISLALRSSAAALKAFSAKRVLLMTPV